MKYLIILNLILVKYSSWRKHDLETHLAQLDYHKKQTVCEIQFPNESLKVKTRNSNPI